MDLALILLTAALVVTTAVYAWFTAKMADEMRRTRALSLTPVLTLDIGIRTENLGELQVTNIGQGTALDVQMELRFEPQGLVRPWTTHTLRPQQTVHFIPASVTEDEREYPTLQELEDAKAVVFMTGTMRDIDGVPHRVNEVVTFSPWWTQAVGAHIRLPKDASERMARELGRIRNILSKGLST